MRDVILIGIATFVLMIFATTSLQWLSRSSALRSDMEQMLSEANKKLKESRGSLSYDSISASGFPFFINISIENPRFTGNIDKLLADTGIKEALNTGDLPPEIQDYRLDGDLVFSVNIFSDKFKAEAVTKSGKNSVCEFKIENPPGLFGELWSFNTVRQADDNTRKNLISTCNNFVIWVINSVFIRQHA